MPYLERTGRAGRIDWLDGPNASHAQDFGTFMSEATVDRLEPQGCGRPQSLLRQAKEATEGERVLSLQRTMRVRAAR